MKRILCMIMLASLAFAAPATNKFVRIEGKAVAKALLKTQPKNALRVKDPDNKTRDLPIMFDNNRLKKIKEKKGLKENEKSGQGFIR